MKLLIMVFLLSLNIWAGDRSFIIENYKLVPEMDYQIELIARNPVINHRLLLDCQSFINGLHYMKLIESRWSDKWFLMLDGNDCEDASNFARSSSQDSKPYCMKVNLENRDLDFNSELAPCL